ncbi:uncharacterized protein RB166_012035 [Leptodactylus fuscus]
MVGERENINQVISLPAFFPYPTSEWEEKMHKLDLVRALRIYLDRTASFRRSENLLINVFGHNRGVKASKVTVKMDQGGHHLLPACSRPSDCMACTRLLPFYSFFHRDTMYFAPIISILIVVTGTFQIFAVTNYYIVILGGYWSGSLTQLLDDVGQETRSTCVKDIKKECATCSEPNKYIDWSQNNPVCKSCRMCNKESFLIEVQSCSLLKPAICQCKPGYYCQTELPDTCARCNLFKLCPPGQGVKQKGSPTNDTKCEMCPSGTFSNLSSDTETCKPHTDCNALNRVTTRRGSVTEDALCGELKNLDAISIANTTYKTSTRYAATSDTTTPATTTPDTTTSVTLTSTTKGGTHESGKRSIPFVMAAIICVTALLIAFLCLSWKQKICNLKLWKNFIQPELPRRTLITNMAENNRKNLLQKENRTAEIYQMTKNTHNNRTMEPGMQLGRDQMNNRIEKIYIMNADTVLVGSVSEVPTRWRSMTTECDSQDSTPLASHYPEQESSKLSANDLMISIEEEERESCTAKAILEV